MNSQLKGHPASSATLSFVALNELLSVVLEYPGINNVLPLEGISDPSGRSRSLGAWTSCHPGSSSLYWDLDAKACRLRDIESTTFDGSIFEIIPR
jgi:hypothetical protein